MRSGCAAVSHSTWHDLILDTKRRHGQMVRAGQQTSGSVLCREQKKLLLFTQNDSTGKDVICILMKSPLLKMHPVFPPP